MTIFELLDGWYATVKDQGFNTGNTQLIAEIEGEYHSAADPTRYYELYGSRWVRDGGYAFGGGSSHTERRPLARAYVNSETGQLTKLTPGTDVTLADWNRLLQIWQAGNKKEATKA